MDYHHWSRYPGFPGIRLPEDDDEMVTARYAKRREMQEIVPNVFLGPYAVAKKDQLELLQRVGITHIICVRSPIEARIIKPNFQGQIEYFVLNISDKNSENIIQYFPQVKRFIDGCLQSQGKVLIHGSVGFSRSPALVIAYLIETFQLPFQVARRYVFERRTCCALNIGFQSQLQEYEHIVCARQQVSEHRKENVFSEQELAGMKRKFEED